MDLHRLPCWLAAGIAVVLTAPATAQSGNPPAVRATQVISGIPSAERLLEDLSWIVGTLAGDQETWDETLQPAAEVFLIGVDPARPIGADLILDREGGQRKRFQIPISDLNEFRDENLEPIDIQSRRRDKDYYELTSDALGYSGWMRLVDDYGSISTLEQDVPEGMASPRVALDALLSESGYDAGVTARNNSDGIADRRESFGEFRENMLAGISRRPSETPEAFELRKRLAHHQTERLERLFIEAEELTAGWTTDAEKEEARGEFQLSALAGTELAKVFTKFGTTVSYFASVPKSADAILHARMNIPVDQTLQNQADEFYSLVSPVWKQRIDGDESLSDKQKQARHKISEIGLEMLHAGRELKALDACMDITPAEGGTNILLAGIRTADGVKAIELIQQLPDALGDLSLELSFDTAGEFAVHRLKPTANVPDALKSFYGDDCEVFVATGKDAVWIAAGTGSLKLLKETVTLVENSQAEANGDVFVGEVRLGPMFKHLDELAVDVGFSPEKLVGRTRPAEEDAEPESGDRRPGQALMSLDLREIALPTLLEGDDDHFILHVQQTEGIIRADMHVQRGILKAAGKVIAKIAAERLAG